MNVKEIKEMIALMNENNLTELEMERDGLKIRLKKGLGGTIEQNIVPSEPMGALHGEKASAPSESKPEVAPQLKGVEIVSPMVGTFYSAPAPDAKPFVTVGGNIEVGGVLCIIEAMKLMNEIKSEVKGRIIKIYVENGDPVEFGQPLFLVEPS